MKEFDCDLHLHGLYSGGVSKNMLIPAIATQAQLKGLHVLCTADALHGKWNAHIRESIAENENGIFTEKESGVAFIIGTEIQCADRVHNLVYLPDLASADALKESLKGKGIFDSWGCGRPRLRMQSAELAERVADAGGIIGPAHAFTPYFSVYAHFNSIAECYGENTRNIGFMELGLSADTALADLISANHNYQFATFSDSHSPWPHRIGREFTRIRMKEPSFAELKKALCGKEKMISLNVGLDPREGKYHLSACNSCYATYSAEDAKRFSWRCPKCRGTITKGVRDRIMELADSKEDAHPEFRPPYMHSLPLAEIIQLAKEVANVESKAVQTLWRDFVDRFGSEIAVLVDAKEEELAEVDAEVAKKIDAFRKGFVVYVPGGGGKYGTPFICGSMEEVEVKKKEIESGKKCGFSGQHTLREF